MMLGENTSSAAVVENVMRASAVKLNVMVIPPAGDSTTALEPSSGLASDTAAVVEVASPVTPPSWVITPTVAAAVV